MFKTLIFAVAVAGTMSFGHLLIHSARELQTGEMKLATINPYATAVQQNEQIADAMGQINQARTGAQQTPQP